MKYFVTILTISFYWSVYGQEKVDEDLLIWSEWSIESYTDGIPFVSSDTVTLFYCGEMLGRNSVECNKQGEFEWELLFAEPLEEQEIQQNGLVIYRSNRTGEKSDEDYMFDDLLYWTIKRKTIHVTYKGSTTTYKIHKIKNRLLVFTKHP